MIKSINKLGLKSHTRISTIGLVGTGLGWVGVGLGLGYGWVGVELGLGMGWGGGWVKNLGPDKKFNPFPGRVGGWVGGVSSQII